jgi:DNA-entry nuclease
MKRLISSRNIKVVLAIVLAITCINGIGLNLNDHPIQVPDGTSSSQSKTTSTSSIPDYTGLASVVLSDGSGLDISDLPSETVLSELDSLGRCGTVEMVVTPDTMPAEGERRGSIGMVKPSGWHTVRDDSLDGKYLYNRCHLIAWCLSGMNAEERNLITGTRYMNVDGMLPFENMVADYVKETKGHVLYRVTPVFYQDELVARGVKMEGWSVEDNGESVCFNVFVYNVQPGISICYADGTSSRIAQEETADPSAQKIYGNRRSKIYHCPGQAAYEEMKDSPNLVIFGSEEQAQAAGYRKAVR